MPYDVIKSLTLWLSAITELAAALIIAVAIVEASACIVVARFADFRSANAAMSHETKQNIRLRLGRWLALSLEFLLAADILRTAVAPTWNEIGQLAAIATIRTALNYFLQHEIDKSAERQNRPREAE